MSWVVFIAIAAYLVFKMASNYKQNKVQEGIFGVLKKHTPDEFRDIVQWEQHLRTELANHHLLHKSGQITENEFAELLKEVLAKHREIEMKYNITEKEMTDYYYLATSDK